MTGRIILIGMPASGKTTIGHRPVPGAVRAPLRRGRTGGADGGLFHP